MSEVILPRNWLLSNLGEVCTYIQRGKGPKYSNEPNEFPIVNQKAIRWNGIEQQHLKFVDSTQWDQWEEVRFIREGDILWNSTGTGTIGRACYLTKEEVKKAKVVDSHVTIVRTVKNINSRFAFFWVMNPEVQDRVGGLYTGTTNQVELSKKMIEELNFPLPPLAEQKVIADKVDILLAQIETTKARLERIAEVLKIFRQSVLAAGVSGKLTEYKEANWTKFSLANICRSISDGDHQAPPKAYSGIPFLVISNVSSGEIDFDSVSRWVPEDYYESLKDFRKPEINDILYTVTGSFGIPVTVKSSDPFCFQRHIAIIKPDHSSVNYKYLSYYLASPEVFKHADSVATGTAQKTISLSHLRKFSISLPNIEEQAEIVRRVEELFAWADSIEQKSNAALARVNTLTQSILGKAFRGELTSDWRAANPELISGNNSAEALLEKIKAERETIKREPRPKRPTLKEKTGNDMNKQIIKVVEALKQVGKPLSGQQLFAAAGYPRDSSTNQVEQFFLDIRDALTIEKSIVKLEHDDGQDWFTLAEDENQEKN